MRRRRLSILLALFLPACGGPGVGSDATINPTPAAYARDNGQVRAADLTIGYYQEDGEDRRSREAIALPAGTSVKVIAVRGSQSQVAVRSGQFKGHAVWVPSADLKGK